MNNATSLGDRIREQWDFWNSEGAILYRPDTLTTRSVIQEGVKLHLIHNACRDVYDRSLKSIDKPIGNKTPFSDGTNPELARTADQQFKVLGNRFACMQYQSILAPVETQETLTSSFLGISLQFACANPELTLMYNAINAGKTVPHQYWLLSFSAYETLKRPLGTYQLLGMVSGLALYKCDVPCYMITFDISEDTAVAVEILCRLIGFMEQKNFNLFLFSNRAYFIPREDVEIPTGFENHRFGGLEMIGYFIMKSVETLESADPAMLLDGIRQISYDQTNQRRLERHLLHELQ